MKYFFLFRCLSSFEESSIAFSKKDFSSLKNDLTKNSELLDVSSWNVMEQFGKAQRLLMSVAMDHDTKNRAIDTSYVLFNSFVIKKKY